MKGNIENGLVWVVIKAKKAFQVFFEERIVIYVQIII